MSKIYCGNKENFTGLLSGTHILGTNYQCLRKGIGIGKNQPYDSSYNSPYEPVDDRKYYCGNSHDIPDGTYFAMGSPSKCLSIGVGVGKSIKASIGPPHFMYLIRYILPYIISLILSILLVFLLKPIFLTKKDDQLVDVIDWGKFIPYYLLFWLIINISIYFFWKNFVRKWI